MFYFWVWLKRVWIGYSTPESCLRNSLWVCVDVLKGIWCPGGDLDRPIVTFWPIHLCLLELLTADQLGANFSVGIGEEAFARLYIFLCIRATLCKLEDT